MPIIDVHIPDDLITADKDPELARRLVTCLVRHEGFGDPAPEYVQRISTAYVHRLAGSAVHTIAQSHAKVVRVHATYHPGGLDTGAMRSFIAEATRIVAEVAEDASLSQRTWITLCETVEGGWGIDGKSVKDRDAPAACHRACNIP